MPEVEIDPLNRLWDLVTELLEDADGDTVEIRETVEDAIGEFRSRRAERPQSAATQGEGGVAKP